MSCQQTELYRAEERALAKLSLPRLTERGAQVFSDQLRDLPWVRQTFPRIADISIVECKERRAVGSVGGLIKPDGPPPPPGFPDHFGVCEMAPQHIRSPLYVIHEICHPLCQSRYGNGSHSPWFVRTELNLAYLLLGSDVYKVLWDEFEASGIDHRIDE